MADLIDNIKNFLKLDEVYIDNNVFRLHYKATGVLLIAFSLLVTEQQYIGDPIDCIIDEISTDIMDTYCWIHSTYSVRNVSASFSAYPGVAPPMYSDDQVYHTYYQWVTLVLFVQALMFYIPRYLWKNWEGKKMSNLLMQLNLPVFDEEVKIARKGHLTDYYLKNLHRHNRYAMKFFFCEILNLVNVIVQIFLTDRFLGNEFTTYGTEVLEFTGSRFENRIDPMDRVFPKVAKCTFHKFGPSGSLERLDALCVLPVNILNEKIYIILWFWFIIVAVVSGFGLIYRIATFFQSFREKLLKNRCPFNDVDKVDDVNSMCDMGDWFILYQLSKSMDPMIFGEVINDIYEETRKSKSMDELYENTSTLPSKEYLRHSLP